MFLLKVINILKILKYVFIISIFIVSRDAMASDDLLEYKVMPKDTITTILQTLSLKPIYGKNGSLAEVLKLNPKKQESLGNCIYVGEILLLPKKIVKIEANKLNENIKKEKVLTKNKEKESEIKIIQPEKKVLIQKEIVKNPVPIKPTEKPKEKPVVIINPPGQSNNVNKPVIANIPPVQNNTVNKPVVISNPPVQSNNLNKPVIANNPAVQSNNVNKPVIINNSNSLEKKSNEIFIANQNGNYSNKNNINLINPQNQSSIKNEGFFFSKTALPALPLRTEKIPVNNEVLNRNSNTNKMSPESEYEFNLDTKNSCNINQSCKSWLWEPSIKCCKPTKRYFLYYENNSL